MKFKILVRTENGQEWWEEYDKDIKNAQEWAKDTIDYFNNTLSPREKLRQLIKVEILDESNERHHRWVKRTDGMSVTFRGQIVDLMFCERCRITGKREGLNDFVKIDSKYRKKAFRECHTAIIELEKA